MTPFQTDKEFLFWIVLTAAILLSVLMASECVGDELPAFPRGFEIEDEYGELHWCFTLEQHKDLARTYAVAYFCRHQLDTYKQLTVEVEVELELMRRKIEVLEDKADEHQRHAEAVELLLSDARRESTKKNMVKTVALVVASVAAAALGGALVWESLED